MRSSVRVMNDKLLANPPILVDRQISLADEEFYCKQALVKPSGISVKLLLKNVFTPFEKKKVLVKDKKYWYLFTFYVREGKPYFVFTFGSIAGKNPGSPDFKAIKRAFNTAHEVLVEERENDFMEALRSYKLEKDIAFKRSLLTFSWLFVLLSIVCGLVFERFYLAGGVFVLMLLMGLYLAERSFTSSCDSRRMLASIEKEFAAPWEDNEPIVTNTNSEYKLDPREINSAVVALLRTSIPASINEKIDTILKKVELLRPLILEDVNISANQHLYRINDIPSKYLPEVINLYMKTSQSLEGKDLEELNESTIEALSQLEAWLESDDVKELVEASKQKMIVYGNFLKEVGSKPLASSLNITDRKEEMVGPDPTLPGHRG